jgi:hypothetical protein
MRGAEVWLKSKLTVVGWKVKVPTNKKVVGIVQV